jgi:hypothetical protein
VRKFQGLATGNSATTKGASSNVTIASGLRVGAQTFARAVQGLNGVISYLNIGKSTLEGLMKITDKMLVLTESATKISISSDARKTLNNQFFKLARDYRSIVADAKFGDRELLTKEGISGIFQVLGLDPEASDTIAAVFEQFVVSKEDDNLASEKSKGSRPYIVPAGAYTTPVSDTPYILEKVTDIAPTSGFITATGATVQVEDTVLNQNPGFEVISYVANNGSLSSMPAGSVSADVTLRGATTGHTVFESTQDFLGFNAGGFNQLYLVDNDGNVVHQVTNFTSAVFIGDISSSVDPTLTVVETVDGGVRSLSTFSAASLGSDPAGSTVTVLDTITSADEFANVFLSYDKNNVMYIRDTVASGGARRTYLMDVATLTPDAWLAAQPGAERIGIIGNDQMVLQFANGGNKDLMLYSDGDGAYTSFITNKPVSDIGYLGPDYANGGTNSYVSYLDSSTNTIVMHNTLDGVTPVVSYDLEGSDSVIIRNTMYGPAGDVQIGIFGTIPSLYGDTDNELFRLSANPRASAGRRLARSTSEYEEIFDKTYDLKTRPNAYRMLHDLKNLRSQLKDNIEGLDDAREMVIKNIDLVRAAGFAFLDLSNQLEGGEDADKVAEQLRGMIRSNARGALSQAENLESIVVAALAFESSDLTSST